MIVCIVGSFLVGILGLWYYQFLHYYFYLHKIPSPKVWPLLGSSWEFRETGQILRNADRNMKQLKTKTFRLHLPMETMVMTQDYKLIEHVLSSHTLIDKGFEYNFFVNWLGLSVLTSSGQRWRNRRKMLTPTFHFQILEQFLDVFNSNAAILMKTLEKKVGMNSFDVYSIITLCTLDIICETAMGTSVNAQVEESSEYVRGIARLGEIVNARIVNPLYHIDSIYKHSALCKEEQQVLNTVHTYNSTIIRNRRQKFEEEQKLKKADDDDLGRKKKVPFLDLLFQSMVDGQPLSDEEIGNEVSTFMVGGHDTTSVAISFGIYALSKNKEVQQKAFEELRDIFGDDKRPCTLEDIHEMKYLELVIKEILRIYPSAALYSRKILEAFTLDGITYPKGLTIGIIAYGVHHDADNYPDPEKFDPERFSRERNDGKKPYAFIPFSAGPRNCIGQKYAMQEMKTLLSTILRNFELHPAKPEHFVDITPNIVLKSANGIHVAITPRKY